jgi:hypothetical protein
MEYVVTIAHMVARVHFDYSLYWSTQIDSSLQ